MGFFDKIIGTVKTDNQVNLTFDTASLVKAGVTAFVTTIVAGLALKALAKTLGL